MTDKHVKSCDCFWCNTPEFEKTLTNILQEINKKKRKERLTILKGCIKGLLALTKLSNVDRLGLLEVIQREIMDDYNTRILFTPPQEDTSKVRSGYIS